MQDRDTRTLLASTALVGSGAFLSVAFLGRPELLPGLAAGALVGFLNLYFWVLVARRLVAESPDRRGLLLRLLTKYALTGLLIALFFVLVEVNLVGFAIGISNLALGPTLGGLLLTLRR